MLFSFFDKNNILISTRYQLHLSTAPTNVVETTGNKTKKTQKEENKRPDEATDNLHMREHQPPLAAPRLRSVLQSDATIFRLKQGKG